jgi:single-stranded DNA-binding protein
VIDALVSGKLFGKPTCKSGQSGKHFVVAKVRAAISGDEAIFINVIAFTNTAKDALLELDDGDSLAIAGTLTPKVWTDKHGEARPALDLVASAVLTSYHVTRKRAVMQNNAQPAAKAAPKRTAEPVTAALPDDRLDDL